MGVHSDELPAVCLSDKKSGRLQSVPLLPPVLLLLMPRSFPVPTTGASVLQPVIVAGVRIFPTALLVLMLHQCPMYQLYRCQCFNLSLYYKCCHSVLQKVLQSVPVLVLVPNLAQQLAGALQSVQVLMTVYHPCILTPVMGFHHPPPRPRFGKLCWKFVTKIFIYLK